MAEVMTAVFAAYCRRIHNTVMHQAKGFQIILQSGMDTRGMPASKLA